MYGIKLQNAELQMYNGRQNTDIYLKRVKNELKNHFVIYLPITS